MNWIRVLRRLRAHPNLWTDDRYGEVLLKVKAHCAKKGLFRRPAPPPSCFTEIHMDAGGCTACRR